MKSDFFRGWNLFFLYAVPIANLFHLASDFADGYKTARAQVHKRLHDHRLRTISCLCTSIARKERDEPLAEPVVGSDAVQACSDLTETRFKIPDLGLVRVDSCEILESV